MDQETVEGFVVDIACWHKYSRDELLDKSRVHGKHCSLMGHCLESGYNLVNADGLSLLDPAATAQAVEAIRRSDRQQAFACAPAVFDSGASEKRRARN